ncbi:uncharacterized protein LOC125229062 isoform X2 [Leguminivora glycinivorella]|nr:uncharacterized protein LOC125229062 isoform X2 [Leguminivora glycinivorella]
MAEDFGKFKKTDLVQLHGAYKCMQREVHTLRSKRWQCRDKRCKDKRRVVKHLMSCPSDKKCSWPVECTLLRQEIKRSVSCREEECPICMQKKQWQTSVSAGQRSNFIDLLVQSASKSSSTFDGNRNFSLHQKVVYTKSIEGEIYKKANSLTDYYRMLATKKWDIEINIEKRERNRQRRHRTLANVQGEERRVNMPYINLNADGAHSEPPDIH